MTRLENRERLDDGNIILQAAGVDILYSHSKNKSVKHGKVTSIGRVGAQFTQLDVIGPVEVD
jgi:hypothetical protein